MTPHQFRTFEVSLAVAQRLCAHHGVPAPTAVRRAARGEVSAVFLLDLVDGTRAVLKVYLRHRHPRDLAGEHAAIRHLHRHSRVPVPAWNQLELESDDLPFPYALMAALPGIDADDLWPTLDRSDAARLVRGCGELLATLHRSVLHSQELAGAGLPSADEWVEREEHEFIDALRRLKGQGWIDPYLLARAQQVWEQGRDVRADEFAPVLLHGDFQLWNIRVDPATLAPVGLVDWGQASFGPASIDVRDLELNLFLDRPRLRREFWLGYGRSEPDEHEIERLRQAALCRALALLAAYWGPTQKVTPATVWHLLAPWSEDLDEGL